MTHTIKRDAYNYSGIYNAVPENFCVFFFPPETRVVMTATQEEITETIMTTEMRHAHNIGETWISALSEPVCHTLS